MHPRTEINKRKNINVVKKTGKKTSSKSRPADFEAQLQELEALVERMEAGDQTLEESLKDFERGVELTRACQQTLKQAEQKVQILLQQNETADLEPFEDD